MYVPLVAGLVDTQDPAQAADQLPQWGEHHATCDAFVLPVLNTGAGAVVIGCLWAIGRPVYRGI